MSLDILGILNDFLDIITQILSYFSSTKEFLANLLVDLDAFDFVNYIRGFVGTIRYVIGDAIYLMTIGTLNVSLFIGLGKAAYQVLHIILNSNLIKKPFAIVKSLIGL